MRPAAIHWHFPEPAGCGAGEESKPTREWQDGGAGPPLPLPGDGLDAAEQHRVYGQVSLADRLVVPEGYRAEVLAVCCPYEVSRFEDAVKSTDNDGKLEVLDIIEILDQCMEE